MTYTEDHYVVIISQEHKLLTAQIFYMLVLMCIKWSWSTTCGFSALHFPFAPIKSSLIVLILSFGHLLSFKHTSIKY